MGSSEAAKRWKKQMRDAAAEERLCRQARGSTRHAQTSERLEKRVYLKARLAAPPPLTLRLLPPTTILPLVVAVVVAAHHGRLDV